MMMIVQIVYLFFFFILPFTLLALISRVYMYFSSKNQKISGPRIVHDSPCRSVLASLANHAIDKICRFCTGKTDFRFLAKDGAIT